MIKHKLFVLYYFIAIMLLTITSFSYAELPTFPRINEKTLKNNKDILVDLHQNGGTREIFIEGNKYYLTKVKVFSVSMRDEFGAPFFFFAENPLFNYPSDLTKILTDDYELHVEEPLKKEFKPEALYQCRFLYMPTEGRMKGSKFATTVSFSFVLEQKASGCLTKSATKTKQKNV